MLGSIASRVKTHDEHWTILSHYREFEFTFVRQTVCKQAFSVSFQSKPAETAPEMMIFLGNRTGENPIHSGFQRN